MQWDAVGDDLRGEERDAGDHQQEAVEGRATLEQRSPAKEKERCCISHSTRWSTSDFEIRSSRVRIHSDAKKNAGDLKLVKYTFVIKIGTGGHFTIWQQD